MLIENGLKDKIFAYYEFSTAMDVLVKKYLGGHKRTYHSAQIEWAIVNLRLICLRRIGKNTDLKTLILRDPTFGSNHRGHSLWH